MPGVTLHDIATDDVWARDHGPMFLSGPPSLPPALIDWKYNAWGDKYPPYDRDNEVPARIAELTGRRRFTPGIILEGGAIDTNGQGTLLTTEPCLLNPNRNPELSRADVERDPARLLLRKKILWLAGGIAGDDTDGHIDELARFVGPTTVVAALESDPKDENYEPLQDNYRRLQKMTDADGRPLTVVPIPMPQAAVLRRHAAAGLLSEFLRGQRRRDRAGVRRSGRRHRHSHAGADVSRPAGRAGSMPPTWCGDWARSTASRSSSRRKARHYSQAPRGLLPTAPTAADRAP